MTYPRVKWLFLQRMDIEKATIELDGWNHVLITIVRFRQTVVKDELGFNKQFHSVRAGLRGPTSSSFLF